MADLATILIEIARKRGYDDGGGEELVKVKRPPITVEERTIQVSTYRVMLRNVYYLLTLKL